MHSASRLDNATVWLACPLERQERGLSSCGVITPSSGGFVMCPDISPPPESLSTVVRRPLVDPVLNICSEIHRSCQEFLQPMPFVSYGCRMGLGMVPGNSACGK